MAGQASAALKALQKLARGWRAAATLGKRIAKKFLLRIGWGEGGRRPDEVNGELHQPLLCYVALCQIEKRIGSFWSKIGRPGQKNKVGFPWQAICLQIWNVNRATVFSKFNS